MRPVASISSEASTSGREQCAPDQQEAACCWICLQESGVQRSPCRCPSFVHKTCLARWQVERLGRSEERSCRFCDTVLPPWQETLLPQRVKPAPEAMINVYGPDGSLHRLPLQPGLAGRRRFLRAVRAALRLPDHATIEMSFEVAVPLPSPSGSGLSPNSALINTQDFSLASHIATVNAGIRRGRRQGAQDKAPPAAAAPPEQEAAPDATCGGEEAAADEAAGVAGGRETVGASAAGPAGALLSTSPTSPQMMMPRQAEAADEGTPRLSKRHRR